MSGVCAALNALGGYNPRNALGQVVSHVVPVANPDKFCYIQLGSDPGTARKVEGFTTTDLLPLWAGQFFKFIGGGASDADNQWEVRVTVNSGTAPTLPGSNATGVWITGGGFWGYERSTTGIETGSWTIEIRSKQSAQVIASWGVNITLQVTP